MFFEMLSGHVPADGRFAHLDLRHSITEFKLPKSLWDLILHCVEPDPNARPQNFHEIRPELEGILRKRFSRIPQTVPTPIPVDSTYWQNRAVAFQVLDLNEDAVECCEKALHIHPSDAEVWQNQG